MDYSQALEFIHSIARFGSKPGLRRVKLLLERMGNPQDRLRFVHVAGTNGKGSTSTMLSQIFRAAGCSTGLYISPFVLDFRERIQLDNQLIPPEELARSTATVKAHWDELDALGEPPTEFEVVVAVAMDYFTRMACDVVVLEVGMGGRFDATNIISSPLVSVITSIGIDHTEYLGDTLAQIAAEKCGIIKPGGVTVSYARQDPEAMEVIREHCRRLDNQLRIGGQPEVVELGLSGSRIGYRGLELEIPLIGEHQIHNTVTAVEAALAAGERGLPVTGEAIRAGISATRFPARMEILGREPLVLLDGAHNLSGAKALAGALELLEPDQRVHLVMGILADKDVEGVLAALLPRCASLTAVTTPNPRALPGGELAALGARYCPATAAGSLEEGVDTAYARCRKRDVLLLCGSLYLAAELRPIALNRVNPGIL